MSNSEKDRGHYPYFSHISTRWTDNDIYGHINNATYYGFFDTVANEYLINEGGMDIQAAEIVGYIVASSCQYHAPIAHPCTVHAGLRVNRIGSSSVEYGIAIFAGDDTSAAAHGTFTHVFVDRTSDQSTPIPADIRAALIRVMPEAD